MRQFAFMYLNKSYALIYLNMYLSFKCWEKNFHKKYTICYLLTLFRQEGLLIMRCWTEKSSQTNKSISSNKIMKYFVNRKTGHTRRLLKCPTLFAFASLITRINRISHVELSIKWTVWYKGSACIHECDSRPCNRWEKKRFFTIYISLTF